MIQIQDMFENGKPDIVLKTAKGFDKKNSFYNLDSRENSFILGIVVLVQINKILVIVFIIDFISGYGSGSHIVHFVSISNTQC